MWSQGNVNYDNVTNLADFNKLAANFGLSAAPAAGMSGSPADAGSTDDDELSRLLFEATGGAADVIATRPWARGAFAGRDDMPAKAAASRKQSA